MAEYVPHHLTTITPEEVPANVADLIHEKSDHYPERRALIQAFRNIMRFSNNDGLITYIAERQKTTKDDHYEFTHSSLHVVDTDEAGSIAGRTHIVRVVDGPELEYVGDKPFEDYTETVEHLRGQGLAERRLRVANLASGAIYGEPLHSDLSIVIDDDVRGIWRKLEDRGEVERYQDEQGDDRFKFKQ